MLNLTSKFTVILTEFPALTTMKLFILLFVNFGLTAIMNKYNDTLSPIFKALNRF